MFDMPQKPLLSQWWRLRWRVEAACGPTDKFGKIEQHFAAWLESGDHVSPAVVKGVEPYLARYIQDAVATGRRWGRTAGLLLGLFVGVAAGVLAGVLT
ncbi:hypothetical protein [Dactylosporangium sp. NPDC051484]|uniref:hypothetical protein n=1 Tax=Dactylosporangium sp. NPDC051484 TaxID=3154942 RepID=UPI00344C2227